VRIGQLLVSRVGANAKCGLTPRSSGRTTAWPLGRAAALFIIVRAAQGPRRCAPLNSNVRPHKCAHSRKALEVCRSAVGFRPEGAAMPGLRTRARSRTAVRLAVHCHAACHARRGEGAVCPRSGGAFARRGVELRESGAAEHKLCMKGAAAEYAQLVWPRVMQAVCTAVQYVPASSRSAALNARHIGQLPVSRVGANAQCGLTPRSSGRTTAWPLGRAAALFIIVRAAQGPRRCAPLNSNVRPLNWRRTLGRTSARTLGRHWNSLQRSWLSSKTPCNAGTSYSPSAAYSRPLPACWSRMAKSGRGCSHGSLCFRSKRC
jgi:hypothetical protein